MEEASKQATIFEWSCHSNISYEYQSLPSYLGQLSLSVLILKKEADYFNGIAEQNC